MPQRRPAGPPRRAPTRAPRDRARGTLSCQFTDGRALHVSVFTAAEHTGELVESDEALPFWADQAALPYDEMWADDRVWLPHVLAGQDVALRAVFAGDVMLDHLLLVGG